MVRWFFSNEAANFGTFLAGITAVIAAIVAWKQFSSWRDQESIRRKAEVAGRFYVAVSNLIETIKLLASPLSFETFDELNAEPRHESHLKRIRKKQESVQDYVKSFNDVRSEAEVYLDDSIIKTTEKLWQLYAEVHLCLFFSFPESIKFGNVKEEEKYAKFIFVESIYKLKEFEANLRDPLKQIARMEQKKTNQ